MSRTYHHGYKAKDRNGINRNWCRNEPKEWRRLYKHKMRRAATREAVSKVLKGEEEVFFPLDKRPWIYYW